MCLHTSDTPHLAKKKDRHLIRCMALPILHRPVFTMETTAALLQRQETERPSHLLPQTATLSTIGSNSLTVIWKPSQLSGSRNWNQLPPDVNAPQPHEPEASDVSTIWGVLRHTLLIGHAPFQMGKKQPHHLRSDRKAAFKRTQWCSSLIHLESSIMRCRKDLPSLTAQHACCNWLIIDSNSLLVHDFLLSHRRISLRNYSSFIYGRHTVIDRVSSSRPRKVRVVLGPSVFLEATNTPRASQRASANCKVRSH